MIRFHIVADKVDTGLVCTRAKKVNSNKVSTVVSILDTGLFCTRVNKVDIDQVSSVVDRH